ncbi:MAG TPA: sulfurtransferase-like selenium metabolism protein YedF [Bacillota bacterium]|nr:sulfurtransferase-like selenium metabolism protein YedF [Bacillota bacterium]
MKVVDNRGLACPQPVINTKRALESLSAEDIGLISLVDNAVARENVIKFARSQGYLAEATEDSGIYRVTINKDAPGKDLEKGTVPLASRGSTGTTLYLIGSDEFGRGDRALGAALMKTFLFSLAEEGKQENSLTLVNSSVKLACEGSAVLPSLHRLCELGWTLKSCGTCLDFYGLKEKLQIGEVTNMYSIVEEMSSFTKVITL